MKKKLALIIFIISAFVYAQDKKDCIFILESAMPHNLNPHETAYSNDAQILDGLYEGLFSYNPVTLEPQYAIANKFKISRDKKRWTFSIRPNAHFSNGESITAESVRFSWIELLKNPNAPYSSLLDIVRGAADFRKGLCEESEVGIYAKDEQTLTVYLASPANYLPKILCHDAFSIIHRNPTVYSGAYTIYDQDDLSITLEKNEYYWDAEHTMTRYISFIQSGDADNNSYLYNTGKVDWVCGDFDYEKIINTKSVQYNAQFGTSYFFFKTSAKKPGSAGKKSVWDYEEFRNAILEAWPWEKMSSSLITATTLVYPLTGYPAVEGFSYTDLKEAQSIMKNAREKYGISQDEVIDLNFEVSEYGLTEENRNMIAQALEPLGVKVNYIVLPAYQYLSHVPVSDADLFGYTWIGDFADPLAFLELFHGSSTLNDSGWQNDEFDSLLEQAELVGEEERYKLLAQAEMVLLDSGMVIPYYHPISVNLINLDEIGGWAGNAFNIHPLKYLFKKEVKVDIPNLVLAR